MKGTCKRKRLIFAAVYVVFLLILAEIGSRAIWSARGVPFLTAHREIHRSFYPDVARLEREFPEKDDECLEVLMLGGSVLHRKYGSVEHLLRERLIRATGKCVRIHNLSSAAHTSLDSLYKYRHLADRRFDVVLVYHGINEARANNCSKTVFRADYSHFSWYNLINACERGTDSRWFTFPYTAKFVAWKAAGRMGWTSFLSTHRPDPETLDHGCDLKTPASYRQNLSGIVEIARQKQEPVLLMSFAFYIPDEYTEQRFEERSLDYTTHSFPVELWGKPECVEAAINEHNRIAADLAGESDQVLFVDQDEFIPDEGLYFNDVCHLTHEGCERFVDQIVEVILRSL